MAKVSVNKKHQHKLHQLLVEFSKIDFTAFINPDLPSADVADVNIEIEEASLKAFVMIHKKAKFDKPLSEMTYTDTITDPTYEFKNLQVLESYLIVKDDALDISPYRLMAAHDEKIHKLADEQT